MYTLLIISSLWTEFSPDELVIYVKYVKYLLEKNRYSWVHLCSYTSVITGILKYVFVKNTSQM